MKDYKEITGFETPSELAAYEKGREHEEKTIVKFIENWNGETNSHLGQLLADKLKSNNKKKLYNVDWGF
jgi:hypothetical protein